MICKYCGAPIEDGAERCPLCGAVLDTVAEPVEAPAEVPVEAPAEAPAEPVEDPAVDAAPMENVDGFEAVSFSEPEPKKKRNLKKILIPVVAVIAAAAVALCIWKWDWICLKWTDLFGEDQDLRDKVTTQQTDQVVDGLSQQYGSTLDNLKGVLTGDKYITTTLELVVSDDAEDLVKEYEDIIVGFVGDDFDVYEMVQLLDGSYVTVAGGGTEEELLAAIRAGINGKEVIGAGVVANLVEETLIASVPMLSEHKLDLSSELSELLAEYRMDGADSVETALVLLDAMPSKETVNKLLKKYISLALAEFDDVSKEKDTLNIGGIKEKVTVLETEITYSDLCDAFAAVLEELQVDTEVEEIILDVASALYEAGAITEAPEEVYDAFCESLDDEIEYYQELADEDYDGELVWTQYLNSSYEIIGMEFEVDGDEILYYATATKGKEFATEVELNRHTIITGEGTNEKGIVNGTYKIDCGVLADLFYFGDLDATIDVKVSNFDKNAFKNGDIKGSFVITPDDELIQELVYAADMPSYIGAAATSMFDLGIKLEINTVGGSDSLLIGISDGSDVLVGVKLTTTVSDEKIEVPTASEDALSPEEWEETIDFDKLLAALEKAGVREEWLEMIFGVRSVYV